jgi:hypothetical protein
MLKFGWLAGALMMCAAPAFAQNAIPDFSGHWQRVDSFQGGRAFDLPESGPGPLIDPRPVTDDGFWVGDHTNPILQPHAAAIVKKRSDFVLAGGIDLPPWSLCWPSGVPQALNLGEPVQFLQTPEMITILYQRDMQVRRVDMNKAHPTTLKPSWYGYSVGRYEGNNTLVIDTRGQNDKASVDRYGTPRSEKIRVVERYTIAPDGRTMTVTLNVEDPDTFTTPWSARVTYRRVAIEGHVIAERICSENNKDASTGRDYPIPMSTGAPVF